MITERELNLLVEILNRAGTTQVERYAVTVILNKLLDVVGRPKPPPEPKEKDDA